MYWEKVHECSHDLVKKTSTLSSEGPKLEMANNLSMEFHCDCCREKMEKCCRIKYSFIILLVPLSTSLPAGEINFWIWCFKVKNRQSKAQLPTHAEPPKNSVTRTYWTHLAENLRFLVTEIGFIPTKYVTIYFVCLSSPRLAIIEIECVGNECWSHDKPQIEWWAGPKC